MLPLDLDVACEIAAHAFHINTSGREGDRKTVDIHEEE